MRVASASFTVKPDDGDRVAFLSCEPASFSEALSVVCSAFLFRFECALATAACARFSVFGLGVLALCTRVSLGRVLDQTHGENQSV
jgi:hypothetical protein